MAGGQGVDPDDPYRVLQVDHQACTQVIEAAFGVLREMTLRSDDDDAPRRLARLGAAHRVLADPERRAAHDLLRGVTLRPIDEESLAELLTLAVANAAPEEVMPAMAGPPGWTTPRREAFLTFHRARRDGLAGHHRELGLAIVADGRLVGVARLATLDAPGSYEAGIWLGRSARGRGIGTAALRALVGEAGALGAAVVVAHTTSDNLAAIAVLGRLGATIASLGAGTAVQATLVPTPKI